MYIFFKLQHNRVITNTREVILSRLGYCDFETAPDSIINQKMVDDPEPLHLSGVTIRSRRFARTEIE